MHLRGIRLWLVTAVCVVTLALLLGGRWLYNQRYLEDNMVKELQSVPGVETVIVTENGKSRTITLGLGEVQDLQAIYQQIGERLADYYDPSAVQVEITGRTDAVVDDVWARTQLVIYQSLFQGNYAAMAEAVANASSQGGLTDYAVQMDWDNAYIRLEHEKHYLYQVIPRQRAEGNRTVDKTAGGGNGGA